MWPTFVVTMALALYFLPAMIAAGRKHNSGGAILALNLLTGWTLIGWIASLVWALTGDVAAPVVDWRSACQGGL